MYKQNNRSSQPSSHISLGKISNRHNRRAQRGSLLVELSCCSFMMLVFVILAVHLTAIIFGAYKNDIACRDAARAAAQGEDLTQATKLAQVVLRGHETVSFVGKPVLKSPIIYQTYNGSPGPQSSPYVELTTSTEVTLPFQPLTFFGNAQFKDGKLKFSNTYTFPIVRLK